MKRMMSVREALVGMKPADAAVIEGALEKLRQLGDDELRDMAPELRTLAPLAAAARDAWGSLAHLGALNCGGYDAFGQPAAAVPTPHPERSLHG
jgi:hypothetical protein